MDNKKIIFITCVTDEKLYSQCKKHIEKCIIPPGFQIEIIPIYGATSMAKGYNQVLKNNAKYKVYLHQDTFILNTNIINDLVTLFETNPSLGLLGVLGCKTFPKTGSWWEGQDKVGKVLAYKEKAYQIVKYHEVISSFEPVSTIDGLFMVSQYDIPWREDIIDGFHFYDTSIAIEFIRRGYTVGIPKQVEPWCLHYHETPFNEVDYLRLRREFITKYQDHFLTLTPNQLTPS